MLWLNLRRIKSRNWETREKAAKRLGFLNDPRSVQALVVALTDREVWVRVRAAKGLGKLRDPSAVEPLVVALADKDSHVLREAAEALGAIGDSRAVEPLLAALNSKDEWVRRKTAEALGKIADSQAIESLVPALADQDYSVRYEAGVALRRISSGWMKSDEAKRAVPSIVGKLKDKDDRVRREAAEVLGAIADPRAIEPLVVALADKDREMRSSAEKALKQIDPYWLKSDEAKVAVQSLVEKLKDKDDRVRREAAEALGRIGDPRAIEPLIIAVTHADSMLQWELVERLLNQIDPNWTRLANTESAVWSLVLALTSTSRPARQSVEKVLNQIDPNWPISEGARLAVTDLIEALSENAFSIEAKKTLNRIDPNWMSSEEAKSAIPSFVAKLKDKDYRVRLCAAEALGVIGDPQAVEPLIATFRETDSDLRRKVAEALGRIGGRRAVETLVASLEDEERSVKLAVTEILAGIGEPRAVAPLIALVDDPGLAEGAIRVLERLLGSNARSVLEKDLLAVASLKDVTRREEYRSGGTMWGGVSAGDDWYTPGAIKVRFHTVDCSGVRELALQELRRRAKESGELKHSLYRVGDRLAGRWEVLNICGGKDRSGMGVVYIVRKPGTEYIEAAKTFQPSIENSEKLSRAIRQEAELWVQLGKHPNIVQASRVEMLGNQLYIFMEYVEPDKHGRNSLRQYLAGVPIPEDQFVTWAMQACHAMAHAHSKGLECHRDIKPDNLLISASGDLKITDFGLAKAYASAAGAGVAIPGTGVFTSIGIEAPGLTCTGLLVGTPGYIAPEIVLGEGGDIRSDIYSFGLVLYQMLTGNPRPPLTAGWSGNLAAYERETLELRKQERFPPLTSRYAEVVAKCLRFSLGERFQDFTALLTELHSLSRPAVSLGGRTDLTEMAALAVAGPDALSLDDLIHRATSLCNLGKLEEALDCIRQAKQIAPGNNVVWNNEGVILQNLGRREEALICLEKSIELNPTWVYPWNNKGKALRDMGRDAEALLCYEHATKYDPDDVVPWVNRGNCLRDLGRHQEAFSCYEQAIQIDENWADAWAGKGVVLAKLGRLQEAIVSLERALELDPQNRFTKEEYIKLLGKQKEG